MPLTRGFWAEEALTALSTGPAVLKFSRSAKRSGPRQGGCPTGQAVITGGGRLKASYVIHTVGPVWSGGNRKEDELLRSAYWSSLALARERGIRTISFPSISTGVYHFPVERAARIAVKTVLDFTREHDFEEIRFVLFDQRTYRAFEEAIEELVAA